MLALFRDQKIVGIKGVWWTMISLLVMCGIKIFLAQHLMMHDDEAYYWYWSRYPMWIYPDHGPLLGFFSAFSVFFLGDSAFALRLMVIILFGFLSIISYFWALAAYGAKDQRFAQRLGFILATLIAVIPHYYGLVLIRTDSLMIFCVFLAIGLGHLAIFSGRFAPQKKKQGEAESQGATACGSEHAETTAECGAEITAEHVELAAGRGAAGEVGEAESGGLANWRSFCYLASSFFWGLAFLAKLTTIFLFFGYFLFFLLVPLAHREWKKSVVWVHFALPFFLCVPMVYWDYLYGFPFAHNFLLRLAQPFRWDRFLEFHFLQWLLYFPTYYALFLFLLGTNSWMYWRKIRQWCANGRFFPAFFQRKTEIFQLQIQPEIQTKLQPEIELKLQTKSQPEIESKLQPKNDDGCVLWQEKVYFLFLSLPAGVYLLQKSFFMELFPNWTIFAAPGATVLVAFYLAEKWFSSRRRAIFYSSNTILVGIMVTFPFLLSSKAPTFAADGTCLYSKYSFLLHDFPKVTESLGLGKISGSGSEKITNFSLEKNLGSEQKPLFVGLDYKLPSMINLYARPQRDAIALTHVRRPDADVFSQPYSLWNMVVARKDLPSDDEDFYFLGEVSLKNEKTSAENLEYSLSKTYVSFEKLHEFTSYCREKKVSRFYLYKVRGYQLFHTLLSRKKYFK